MVSLRKNDEEQKMQRIRMDVRTAFLRHQEACNGRSLTVVCPAGAGELSYYAEPLSGISWLF